MSNKIFKSIIIEIAYNETKLSSDYVLLLRMYPLLRELILNKVEILNKLIRGSDERSLINGADL